MLNTKQTHLALYRQIFCASLVLIILLSTGVVVQAQQPTSQVVTFNGSIPTQPDGPVALRFRLYNVDTGGTFLFEETQTVTVSAEKFTVRIGDVTAGGIPVSLFRNNPSLWIAFALEGTPDTEIGSRTAITSSGYAHSASTLAGPVVSTINTLSGDVTLAGNPPVTITPGEGTLTFDLAPNGINNSHIADGSLSPAKIAGTAVTGGGTGVVRQLPLWADATRVGNSVISQSLDNKIGIGTTNPLEMLHIAGANAILRMQSSQPNLWTVTEYKTDQREWHTGVAGSQVPVVDLRNKYYIFDANTQQFRMIIDTLGRVGIGTTNPGALLDVNTPSGLAVNAFSGSGPGPAVLATTVGGTALRADAFGNGIAIWANGIMRVDRLDTETVFSNSLCWRYYEPHTIGYCSSSLRYKTDVRPFLGGLDIVNRLRPIAFTWKRGGVPDIGLAAEEVEKVEPLLTFRNDKGEIEGVRYNQLSAVFVNAFAEQQDQIRQQQAQLEVLKQLVCQLQPNAEACK